MNASEEERLKACALRLLARREHSSQELKQKLLKRKFPRDKVIALIDNFVDMGWQSNQRFAEAYLRSQLTRGYGPLKIQYNLRDRGLDASLIESLMVIDPQVWQDSINNVWQRKYQSAIEKGEEIPRDKQLRFLQSRGFTNEQITKLLGAVGR